MDGMKEKFCWSKDVIAKMLRELAEEIEREEDLNKTRMISTS